ncbi:MAG: carbohydrate kinase family protein [Patescibacteria group bacterium]
MKYDVITFGSATRDVFLKGDGFKEVTEKKFFSGRGICLSLGSKIPIKEINFDSGGGGINAAFTFKNQGLKVAFCGMVGDDFAGQDLTKELRRKRISTDFLFIDKSHHTNYSIIILAGDERTILAYRGASEYLDRKRVPLKKLASKWFYIAPLSGKALQLCEFLLKLAKKNRISVALNPSKEQLSLPKEKLKRMLSLTDVVFLNQEEASLATKLPHNKEEQIFRTLDKWVRGIVVMTKGPFGVVVSDGNYLYSAGIFKTKVVDRTGSGDAFGSGFIMGLIKATGNQQPVTSKAIEYAMQFGSANATSGLKKLGAKNGLLVRGEDIFKFGKLKISKRKL